MKTISLFFSKHKPLINLHLYQTIRTYIHETEKHKIIQIFTIALDFSYLMPLSVFLDMMLLCRAIPEW